MSAVVAIFFDEWLTKMRGQHYFINNVHFCHYLDRFSIDTITAVVNSTTEDCLTRWFVDNYMRKCAKLCPENLSLLCSDMVTYKIIHDTASSILKWRDQISIKVYAKHVLSLLVSVTVPEFRSWEFRPENWMFFMFKHILLLFGKLTYIDVGIVSACGRPQRD